MKIEPSRTKPRFNIRFPSLSLQYLSILSPKKTYNPLYPPTLSISPRPPQIRRTVHTHKDPQDTKHDKPNRFKPGMIMSSSYLRSARKYCTPDVQRRNKGPVLREDDL